MSRIRDWLLRRGAHPLTRGLELDGAGAIAVHRQILRDNPLLRARYAFVYEFFRSEDLALRPLGRPCLEVGSGAGFLKSYIPDVITSDVVAGEGIDRVEDACALSFTDASLRAVYVFGVLHHIPEPEKFLRQVDRVLVPGGRCLLDEPSSTLFGYFMNRHFHAEHTDRRASAWGFAGGGRLTGANMALPYIIFCRDRGRFEELFPRLKVRRIVYHDFLRYTLSGGMTFRPFVPRGLFGAVNGLEKLATPLMRWLGHEMIVVLEKT
jgi:SAM-dependent methyltransferase